MTTDDQQVHRIEHDGVELGFVVIDSSIEGRARGGLRLAPAVTELELRAAARAMTLKYGLLGLPRAARRPAFTAIRTRRWRSVGHGCSRSGARSSRSCAPASTCPTPTSARAPTTSAG